MNDILYNPVYNALRSGDAHFARGTEKVAFFDEEVSPFVGFPEDYENGFADLHNLLPAGRKIIYATPEEISIPAGWDTKGIFAGLQFMHVKESAFTTNELTPVLLNSSYADEMVALAALTRPGPFNKRTIEFGHYHGFFQDGRLVAMTGQRLHVHQYTEISAVCTHPDHTGKGYAAALMQHQLEIIQQQGKRAFLHVRNDNARAIALYQRLGFEVNRVMNFYFMVRN